MVSSAKFYLRLILFYQGILTIAMGLTWVFGQTPGRLRGVMWLQGLSDFIPYLSTDDKIGLVWIISGAIMVASGSRLSLNRPWLENTGFALGFSVPLFVGGIFIAAFILGDAPSGYVMFSYLMFISPYFAYLRLKPHKLSRGTGSMEIREREEDGS